MNNEKTGKLIRTIRTEKEMTQKELAQIIQVSNAAVSKWENGHGFPDISLLEPLAEALNISIEELVSGERNPVVSTMKHNAVIKDIIQLSEMERNRRNAKQSIITGLFILLLLLSGYGGIFYLWSHQNESVPISTAILNLSALFFGFLSWILAIYNIFKCKSKVNHPWGIFSTLSFFCCAVSLWLPTFVMDLLVRSSKYGDIQDLAWGYNFVSIILLMMTVILNVIAYYAYKTKQ